ncbi:hypothetical protein IKE71_01060 [Candidatus Saccharibacteria bacterium]|nr:hypothetical protein [Candidatus Saccharibacteria bacterium]
MIDLHSHLLPSIDDGVETFDESLEILAELEKHGVKKLFLTPHYIPETIYNSPRVDNFKLLHELKKLAAEQGIGIELYLGNELYINREITNLLKKKLISPLADSKYLLIELPMSGHFEGYEDIFYNLQAEGYKVILAHPERYVSVQKEFKILERLSSQGVLFQSNLGSINGQYGRHAEKTVKKMAKRDLIFAFGTDTHHMRDFDEIDDSLYFLAKIYGEAKLRRLLEDNPLKILETIK